MIRDEIDAYIQRIREEFDKTREETRTRSIAMGYSFGRNDQRVADGCDPDKDGTAIAFADFYQTNTTGQWCDLIDLYSKFRQERGAA